MTDPTQQAAAVDPAAMAAAATQTGTATTAPSDPAAAAWAALSSAAGVQSVTVTTPTGTARPATAATTTTAAAAQSDDAGPLPAGVGPTFTADAVMNAAGAAQSQTASGGQGQSQGQGTTGQSDEAIAASAGVGTTGRRDPAASPTSVDAQAAAMTVAGAQATQQAAPTTQVQANTAAPLPLAEQVATGAAQAARRIGQKVEVVLQPEGLGTVSLRVSVERSGLGIHIATDNLAARDMIQANWQQLHQSLDQRGLSVQSLFLDLAGGQGSNQAFGTFQQFAGQQSSGQQAPGQQARGGSSTSTRRDDSTIAAVDGESRVQVGAGSTSRVDYRV
jgi:flagellar hook-length control protein FliK